MMVEVEVEVVVHGIIPHSHIPEHLSIQFCCFFPLIYSLTFSASHFFVAHTLTATHFICFLLKIHNEMSLTSAIIGSKSIREQSHRTSYYVAMQIKHIYGKKKIYNNENVPNSSPLLASRNNNKVHKRYERKSNNDRKTTREYEKKTELLLESMFECLKKKRTKESLRQR